LEQLDLIRERMRRQDLDEALNHLNLAEGALGRGEWEAANSQIRACLESLFGSVARVRLGSSKTRGQARKELETSGVLREPEARLVQSFFGVASGEGSHAGTSNEDEARGRFLAGLGICLLGLALMPELVRVEDALADDLREIAEEIEGHEVWLLYGSDAEIRTSCPSCGDEQTLSECEMKREGDDTVYWCWSGCQKIIVVGPLVEPLIMEGETPWGKYVIRNVSKMHVPIYDKDSGKRTHMADMFALPKALVRRGPKIPGTGRIDVEVVLGTADPVDQSATDGPAAT
jgi:hypothetical protein